MVDLFRIRVAWAGGPGGPGVTTLFSTAIHQLLDVKNFFTAIGSQVPPGYTWTVPGNGDKIDSATGALTGAWSAGADSTATSSGASNPYASPAGAMIKWQTATIVGTRRLQGRVFVVPILGGAFDTSGTLAGTCITSLNTAAANLVSAYATKLVVWSRPFAGKPAVGTRPARPARTGSYGIITGAITPDKAVILRSRRD